MALSTAADQLASLSIGATEGALLDDVRLTDASWRTADSHFGAQQLRLAWSPGGLLRWSDRRLVIRALEVEGVDVSLPPPAPEPDPEPLAWPPTLPDVTLPVAIDVQRLSLRDFVITPHASQPISIDAIDARLALDETGVRIERLDIATPEGSASATASLGLAAPHDLALDARLDLALPASLGPRQRALATLKASGPLAKLAIDFSVEEPAGLTLNGVVEAMQDVPAVDLAIRWQGLQWPLVEQADAPLVVALPGGELKLDGPLSAFKVALDTSLTLPAAEASVGPEGLRATALADVAALLPWLDQPQRPIAAELDFQLAAAAPFNGAVELSGALDDLNFALAVRGAAPAEPGDGAAGLVLTASGSVQRPDSAPIVVDVKSDWRAARWPLLGVPQVVVPTGRAAASGPLDALVLDVSTRVTPTDLAPIDIALLGTLGEGEIALQSLTVAPPTGTVSLAGTATWAPAVVLDLSGAVDSLPWPLTGEPQVTVNRATLALDGPLEAINTALDTTLDLPPLGETVMGLRAVVGPQRVRLSRLDVQQGEGSAAFSGDVLMAPALSVDLDGEWQSLGWPLPDGIARSPRGQLSVKGPAEALAINLSTAMEVPKAPAAALTADLLINVDEGKAALDSVTVDTLDGRIGLGGTAAWQPQPAWDLTLDVSQLAPGAWPGLGDTLPGRVSARLTTDGELADGVPNLSLTIASLDGKLRGYPLAGSGKVQVVGDAATIDGLRLSTGENRLEVDGRASASNLDLDLKLKAPRLDTAWPGLGGALNADVEVNGAPHAAAITLDVKGNRLAFEQLKIRSVAASGTASLAGKSDLVVNVRGVSGPADVASADVKLNGTPERHVLALDVSAAAGDVSAELAGGASGVGANAGDAQPAWQGELRRLVLAQPQAGRWQLQASAALSASASAASLGRACLAPAANDGTACLEGQWSAAANGTAQSAAGEVRLDALSLALLRPFLPPDVRVTGAISGSATATLAGDALTANVDLKPAPGEVQVTTAGGDRFALDYAVNTLTANVAGNQADVAVRMTAGPANLDANVQLGLAPDGALGGRIRLDVPDVTPLLKGVTAVANAAGRIDVDARLGGTLSAPAIDGAARVTGARASIPDAGITLEDVALNVRNQGASKLVIEGGLTSGGGRLNLDGSVLLDGEQGFPVDIRARGENVQVARLPTVVAFASPDLRIRRSGERTQLEGELVIPRADVRLRKLPPSVTRVSSDEVIVGADATARPAAQGAPVDIDVNVRLGDAVTFDGFGLLTRLSGGIAVRGRAGRAPTAQGQLSLVDGTFEGYGQDLEIRKGQLLFAGPLSAPTVNVEAVRVSRGVTAGIRLAGPVRQPTSTLFSTPPLPQSDQLSYLLTGRPVSGGGSGDTNLGAAAAALGLAQTAELQRAIGARLGVDEFGITNDGDLDSTGLTIGKRLSPALTMRFAVGLFDAVGSVLLDYELTDNISIEASASQSGQGVDLLYELER